MSSNATLPNLNTNIVNPIIPTKNTEYSENKKNNIQISNNNPIKKESDPIKNIIIGYYIFATIVIVLYFLNDGEINEKEYYLRINNLQFNNSELEYSKLNNLIFNYIQTNSKRNLCIDRSKSGCLKFRLQILDLINQTDPISKEQRELYILMYNSYSHPLYRLIKYVLIGYIGVPLLLLSCTLPVFAR